MAGGGQGCIHHVGVRTYMAAIGQWGCIEVVGAYTWRLEVRRSRSKGETIVANSTAALYAPPAETVFLMGWGRRP